MFKLVVFVLFVAVAYASPTPSESSTGPAESSSSSTGPAPGPAPPSGVIQTLMAGFKKDENSGAGDLLIDHGVATPNQRYFTDTEYYTVIYFWLLPTETNTYNISTNISSPTMTDLKWVMKNEPIKVGSAPGMCELQIRYTGCPSDPGKSNRFPIFATVNIPGANPIQLNWQKECTTDKPVYHPAGWSGFETFCFVVFILTLVFCVAGCGYNYLSRGRSGTEIIPCWNVIQRYFCCKGERRYSPRMDYDTPIGDDDNYGASYQADL